MARRSRYDDVKPFSPDPLGRTNFRGLAARRIGPATAAVEHTVKSGERMDRLAQDYFNDDRLWWRIVDANRTVLNGGDLVAEFEQPPPDEADQTNPLHRESMVSRIVLVPRKEE